ncbi:MAG: hypothetical protein QF915_00405 [Candidatus Woesearchaeota archaeon]|jgi:hypothetical protein|nr:hypothetical protein [Candidatus Woesearchaeota archaeon]MDP7458560.1 hypothetical protein [Candidatus Woesearchaeota archaeon]
MNGIIIILIVYVIFELIRKIFGGSLGFEELTISLLGIILVTLFKIIDFLYKINTKLESHLAWHKAKSD